MEAEEDEGTKRGQDRMQNDETNYGARADEYRRDVPGEPSRSSELYVVDGDSVALRVRRNWIMDNGVR